VYRNGPPLSRRELLAVGGVTAASLAGCTTNSDPPETSTSTPEFDTASRSPTCESAGGRYVYSVTPRGYTIAVEDRSAAESIRQRLRERYDVPDTVETSVVESPATPGVALELGPGPWDLESIRSTAGDGSGVDSVRFGRTVATVRRVGDRLRSELASLEDVERSNVALTIVDPDVPDPRSAVTVLSEVGEVRSLEAAETFSIRLERADGPVRLAGAGDVSDAGTVAEPQPGVSLRLRESAVANFTEQIREVPRERLVDRQHNAIRVHFEGETIWEGFVSRELATDVRSGEWSGELVVATTNQSQADQLADSLGLLTFDVPTRTSIETCD